MKLGPVHVVTDATMGVMQAMLHRFAAEAARVGPLIHGSPYLHPVSDRDRLAPPVLFPPDSPGGPSEAATDRVLAAFARATAEPQAPPAVGMWDRIEQSNAPFLSALRDGDRAALRGQLAGMFRTDLVWGLGHGCKGVFEWLSHPTNPGNPAQRAFTDVLVSLAEAVGAARLTSPEQQLDRHRHALDADLDELFRQIERRTGLDLSQPAVGAATGCQVAGRVASYDTLTHGYTLHRLRQLGVNPGARLVEIGGGFGCLAGLADRAGYPDFTVHDLPWVNAIQGYYLILALPPGSVRLFGEDSGKVTVRPHWCFDELPDRSADAVVNTNSLPELGEATARAYLAGVRRVLRPGGVFLSINQEAKAVVPGIGPQQCVAELAEETGGLRCESRSRYWLRQGYVEEVFRPL
jgi:putative sugar O-methyltransferase